MHPRVIRSFVALSVVLAACGADKTTSPVIVGADVYTAGSSFSPFAATVAVGATVQFHISRSPEGDGHNVIFDHTVTGAPEDIGIINNANVTVVSRVFPVRGTFSYVCTVHPGMNGEIDVQ